MLYKSPDIIEQLWYIDHEPQENQYVIDIRERQTPFDRNVQKCYRNHAGFMFGSFDFGNWYFLVDARHSCVPEESNILGVVYRTMTGDRHPVLLRAKNLRNEGNSLRASRVDLLWNDQLLGDWNRQSGPPKLILHDVAITGNSYCFRSASAGWDIDVKLDYMFNRYDPCGIPYFSDPQDELAYLTVLDHDRN